MAAALAAFPLGSGDALDGHWLSAHASRALTRPRQGLLDMEDHTVAFPGTNFVDLAGGPYIFIAGFLDPLSLCQADATCLDLRERNRGHCGPWFQLGSREFRGLDLDGSGLFQSDNAGQEREAGTCVDWKRRYLQFQVEIPTFRAPFSGTEITVVQQPDEIAYCSCSFRTDLLGRCDGIYVEIEVAANPDNVSLAVVDFEGGGCSSVTFSPDTGAVIRERKVCEIPRKVEGAYIQPLSTTTSAQGFEGSMGLYLYRGNVAFFRRCAPGTVEGKDSEPSLWESTGFVTDLKWAEGHRLTSCLAFRNEGTYQVRVTSVRACPPVMPLKNEQAYQPGNWYSLDWEAEEVSEVQEDVVGQ